MTPKNLYRHWHQPSDDQISCQKRHPPTEGDGLENLIRQQGVEKASEQKRILGRIRV
jgi:hypothetical protein